MFKLTGKRIFLMAPIHHHFEKKGWAEPKVIVRTVVQKVYVRQPSKAIAQNASRSNGSQVENASSNDGDEMLMGSQRAKRDLKRANEIIVTEDDRI